MPALGFQIAPGEMRRFWTMLTHYHGQIFNASELGRSLGLSHNTCRKCLEILASTFMVRVLQPWHENINKRQVKPSKLYFRDSGILHALFRIPDYQSLLRVPKLDASWEGYVLEEVIRSQMPIIDSQDCYFWSTQSGAELDLLIVYGDRKIGFEFKYQDAPKITKFMHIALEDLGLEKLYVVYPGENSYQADEKVFVTNLMAIQKEKIL